MKTSFRLVLFFLLQIPFTALPAEQRTAIPLDHSPALGPENAPVTIIEFIDFQ